METALKSSESFAGQRRASVEPQYLGSIFKNSIFKCFSVGDKFIFKPKGKNHCLCLDFTLFRPEELESFVVSFLEYFFIFSVLLLFYVWSF